MYSYGPPHMAVQKQDDQHEHTFSNYVRIQDVVLKTCLGRWTIGGSGERGSGISVLPAQHDDDVMFWPPCWQVAQSAGAVEYTDCTSAEGQDPTPHPNECPGYDTKQSDGEVPVVLELWEMRSTPSLPLLLGPLWPRMVAPDRALSMG